MEVPSINFAYGEFLNFTAEAQSPQREVIFYLPLILQKYRRTGRTAIKRTQALWAKIKPGLSMHDFVFRLNR